MSAADPAPQPSFGFAMTTTVDIADTDLGGVVYYARYAHFLDRGLMAYRAQLGIPALGPDGHLFVVRNLEVEYLRSARFGDELIVHVRTARVGRSSHTVEFQIDDASSGAVVLRARQVIVGVSAYEAGRPTRVPADLAERIAAFEAMA